jgi:hypothetical protein
MIIQPREFALQRGMPGLQKHFEAATRGDANEQRLFSLILIIGAQLGFLLDRVTEEEEIQSRREGFEIMKQLSDEGYIWGMRSTATCLAIGIGTEQNIAEARRLADALRARVAAGDRTETMEIAVVDALDDLIAKQERTPSVPRVKPELPGYGL